MNNEEIKIHIQRHRKRLKEFGVSPKTLGCGAKGRQTLRYSVLCDMALKNPSISILDVGCGFGDLYEYLKLNGWNGDYCGIDVVPEFIDLSKSKFPSLKFYELNIMSKDISFEKYDLVVASGTFNEKLNNDDHEKYIETAICNMYSLANIAVCVDFMTTYVDYQHPLGFHMDPLKAFSFGKKLSKRVMLRHDYMPYEFALFIYCDDSISSRNVFENLCMK